MLHRDKNCHRALAGCCENVWFERDWGTDVPKSLRQGHEESLRRRVLLPGPEFERNGCYMEI